MNIERKEIAATKNGRLEGEYKNGVFVFKGIPYAESPTGNLRWLPPRPAKPWEGVRPAKRYGAIAPQLVMTASSNSPGIPNFGDQPQSEDCLFLNIWTPGLDDAERPVMVWIHGGAFIIGCGSESFMEGGSLAKRGDIVLVSINYRLGAAGFMNLNEITRGKIPATGNEGLLDQIAALEWVRENIAAFGGNPDNVTVFGFSAGGMSVATLLGMPAARGAFHKAMNRSGAANVVSGLEKAVEISEGYLGFFGLKGRDTDGIRNLTTEQLLEGQRVLGEKLRAEENRATPFQPVVDGKVLPDLPIISIRKGSAKDIPILAGNMRDELKSMYKANPTMNNIDDAGLIKRLNTLLPKEIVPELVKAYRKTSATPADILAGINTDMMFRIPTIQLVEAQRDNGAPAFNYLFTYKSPAMDGALGAMHGLDNPFLFGALNEGFTGKGPGAVSLMEKVQDSCAAFARTGDPSCESAGAWPVYGTGRMTMIFDIETRLAEAPFEDERRAWDGYKNLNTTPL